MSSIKFRAQVEAQFIQGRIEFTTFVWAANEAAARDDLFRSGYDVVSIRAEAA